MENLLDVLFARSATAAEPSQLKIQLNSCELNVWLSAADLERLGNLAAASWDSRESIRAGVAAGAPVFWSSDKNSVTIMIGHDDETWDIAVSFEGVAQVLSELGLA